MKTKLVFLILIMLGLTFGAQSQNFSLTKRLYRKGYYIQKSERSKNKKHNKDNIIKMQEKETKSANDVLTMEKINLRDKERESKTEKLPETLNANSFSPGYSNIENKSKAPQENLLVSSYPKKIIAIANNPQRTGARDNRLIDMVQKKLSKMSYSKKDERTFLFKKRLSGGGNALLLIGSIFALAGSICVWFVSILIGLILAILGLIFVIIGAIINKANKNSSNPRNKGKNIQEDTNPNPIGY